jgi:hypothetical protein
MGRRNKKKENCLILIGKEITEKASEIYKSDPQIEG